MEYNQLCGLDDDGDGEYTTWGITKLCKGLKGSSVTSLRCALGRACSPFCQCPLTLCAAFTASRLRGNSIGGYYNDDREFVSNTDGIIALCEGLKGSAVTSLECAAAPKCLPFCQRPLTRKQTLCGKPIISLTSPAPVSVCVTASASIVLRATRPTIWPRWCSSTS